MDSIQVLELNLKWLYEDKMKIILMYKNILSSYLPQKQMIKKKTFLKNDNNNNKIFKLSNEKNFGSFWNYLGSEAEKFNLKLIKSKGNGGSFDVSMIIYVFYNNQ